MITLLQKQSHQTNIICLQVVVSGFVQGVGFRPFVFRLAEELSVKGYVINNKGQVSIVAEADQQTLVLFCQQLVSHAPVNAKPCVQSITEIEAAYYNNFSIRKSTELSESDIHILPDLPVCDQCLKELFDKKNRRYLYPFINCTQCGPRNSIITKLPYDRENTSMQSFLLCTDCDNEYNSTKDRRFHAEPVACDKCGPVLNYVDDVLNVSDNNLALEACVAALKKGLIIAVKGVGGYHLMCDATSADAVGKLRRRKRRPDKPFAVLMDQSLFDEYVEPTEHENTLLHQSSRPIVLMQKNSDDLLAGNLAAGFNRIGVMLPSNPLQHLLCHFFKKPLVATSANVSGEPIITDNADATMRLETLCDAYLHHNRKIVRPADDPVMLHSISTPHILRTGRGLSPTEFTLPFTLNKAVLAVGGHTKNTVALAWKNRMVISAHNGDLSSLRGYQTFRQSIGDLQKLYQVKAEKIVCDAHSDYGSAQWASQSGLPVIKIYHHHAHASSLALEYPQVKNWLVFCWDGVGLGSDGTIWGGETFSGSPGNWQRVTSFKSFLLPGGEKTSREAWRVAASLCWHSDIAFKMKSQPVDQLNMIWHQQLNCPQSSAVGRLFSAAAALLNLLENESFEGHGPMLLEALAETTQADAVTLAVDKESGDIARINWTPLIKMLKDTSLSKAYRARCFHETLAQCVCDISLQFTQQNKNMVVGLSGGVFQNQLLVRLIKQRFEYHHLDIKMPTMIPVNDGGICAGQVIEYYSQRVTGYE